MFKNTIILEGFNVNNVNNVNNINDDVNAVDLLSKYKSSSSQQYSDDNAINLEMKIHSWSTKIYNMQIASQQIKAIGLYKPILVINGIQYSKLGDMLSQNTNYSQPNSKEFSLLVKQTGSDIKPPTDYEIVVNYQIPGFNNNYYKYEKYLSGNDSLQDITSNLNNCLNSYNTLNTIIQDNIATINNGFIEYINNKASIIFDEERTNQPNKIINKHTYMINQIPNIINKEISYDLGTEVGTNVRYANPILTVPLGIRVQFHYTTEDYLNDTEKFFKGRKEITNYYRSIILPDTLDKALSLPLPLPLPLPTALPTPLPLPLPTPLPLPLPTPLPLPLPVKEPIDQTIKTNLLNVRDEGLGGLYKPTEITYNTYTKKICELIPITIILDYIRNVCLSIQNIYKMNNLSSLYNDFKLCDKIEDVTTILEIINYFIDYTDSGNYDSVMLELKPYCVTTSLLGNILYIINSVNIQYTMPMFKYELSTMVSYRQTSDRANEFKIISYKNDIISKIPASTYNILRKELLNMKNFTIFKKQISDLTTFTSNITENKFKLFPIQIYKPIPPSGYSALGYVFCNTTSDLDIIKQSQNIACIPEQCVKIMRPWLATDKVFEYNKDSVYWAIYLNPYTGTFVCTNTNSQQLPDGNVCKVVACVAKCNAVDELVKSDDCARKYYNMSKKNDSSNQKSLNSTLVSDQEEIFYLDKLKAQSNSIAQLKRRAQQMQITGDKATIVNSEMNKHKLQNYVDTQKQNIDIIMKRLQSDKNKITTQIIIPPDAMTELQNMIINSNDLSTKKKKEIIHKLLSFSSNNSNNSNSNNIGITEDSLREILNSCPQYDLSNLVKKTTVADVCYGCDSPN